MSSKKNSPTPPRAVWGDWIITEDKILNRFWNHEAETAVVPDGVVKIGRAFHNFQKLKSVVLPDSVTEIGIEAFSESENLKSVNIPDGVTKIGLMAFSCCKSLPRLVLPESVAEIGSGAGFPSLVLKILRPDLKFSLFESVGKKCEFLNVAVDKLGLKDVNIYNVRAEEASRDKKFRDNFDCVTARAVARMNSLSEYCLPFVKVGGVFIAYKSGDVTEIEEAKTAYKALSSKLESVYCYELPEGYGERSLAIVKKLERTSNRYPRGQGKERKLPL